MLLFGHNTLVNFTLNYSVVDFYTIAANTAYCLEHASAADGYLLDPERAKLASTTDTRRTQDF